jgi:UDP:flavonoid glycosyltransferase YjiC (YdhE family)
MPGIHSGRKSRPSWFGPAIDYAHDTMDALRKESVDAVLTNDLLAGPIIAAEAAGIPCALLAPHVSVRPIEGTPFCFDGSNPSDTPEFLAAESTMRARFIDMAGVYLPALNRARAAFGLPPLRDIFDHYDRVDRPLIGISVAFDSPATRLPANLRYVGPLLDMPGWAQPWTSPWPRNTGRSRVLVSLSTRSVDFEVRHSVVYLSGGPLKRSKVDSRPRPHAKGLMTALLSPSSPREAPFPKKTIGGMLRDA